jgi:hypothetical protein
VDDFLSHPMFLVTYSAVLGIALVAVVGLFRRLAHLEARAERLDEIVSEMREDLKHQGAELTKAMTEFRIHMAEEAASVERLETLILGLNDRGSAGP